jgi:hypothetical protein
LRRPEVQFEPYWKTRGMCVLTIRRGRLWREWRA